MSHTGHTLKNVIRNHQLQSVIGISYLPKKIVEISTFFKIKGC